MMDLPKCHCFQGGFEDSQGQEYVDTVASEVMAMICEAVRQYPVCEEALPYFVATMAASALMSAGVVTCSNNLVLDAELLQRKSLEVLEHVRGVVEMRCARLGRNEAGAVN